MVERVPEERAARVGEENEVQGGDVAQQEALRRHEGELLGVLAAHQLQLVLAHEQIGVLVPHAALLAPVQLAQHLQTALHARRALPQMRRHALRVELQQVGRLRAVQRHEPPVVAPAEAADVSVHALHQLPGRPVVERHELAVAAHGQAGAAPEPGDARGHLQHAGLLELRVQSQRVLVLRLILSAQSHDLHAVVVAPGPPHEVDALAVRLAAQLAARVHHVLALAHHGQKPPRAAVAHHRRRHVAAAQRLRRDRHFLPLQHARRVQLLPVHHALPHLLPHAPHHAALRVHAHRGTGAAHRVDAVALVVAQNHVVVVAAQTDAPRSVQRGLQDHALATIRAAVEDDHLVVLAAAQQIGKTRVELHRGEVVFVPRERLNARLGLVVPDFDRLEGERKREGNAVVAAGGQVGFVVAGVEVQAVYAF